MDKDRREAPSQVTPENRKKTYAQKLEERIEILKRHFTINSTLVQLIVLIDALQKGNAHDFEIQIDLDRKVREINNQLHMLNMQTNAQLSSLRKPKYS